MCMRAKLLQSRPTLCDPIVTQTLWPSPARPRLLCPWGFSRQEYWSGLPCPPPGDLLNLGNEPRSPALWEDSLPSEPPGKPLQSPLSSLKPCSLAPQVPSSWTEEVDRWALSFLEYHVSPVFWSSGPRVGGGKSNVLGKISLRKDKQEPQCGWGVIGKEPP